MCGVSLPGFLSSLLSVSSVCGISSSLLYWYSEFYLLFLGYSSFFLVFSFECWMLSSGCGVCVLALLWVLKTGSLLAV